MSGSDSSEHVDAAVAHVRGWRATRKQIGDLPTEDNWDGYGAAGVHAGARVLADRLAIALDLMGWEPPDENVFGTSDGKGVVLEWQGFAITIEDVS